MDFHGHTVDLENLYHLVALEYAKSELSNFEDEATNSGKILTPQDKIDTLYSDYLMAYGHLCNKSEKEALALLEHTYLED